MAHSGGVRGTSSDQTPLTACSGGRQPRSWESPNHGWEVAHVGRLAATTWRGPKRPLGGAGCCSQLTPVQPPPSAFRLGTPGETPWGDSASPKGPVLGGGVPPRPSSSLHTHQDPSFCIDDCSLRLPGAGCQQGGCPRAGQAGPRPWELGVGGDGWSAGEDPGEGVQGEDTWLSGVHEGLRRPRWAGREGEPAPRWVGALGRAGASRRRQRAGRGTSKPAWAAPFPPPGARQGGWSLTPASCPSAPMCGPGPGLCSSYRLGSGGGSGPVLPRPLWLLPKDALEGRAAGCRGRWQVSDAGHVLKAE